MHNNWELPQIRGEDAVTETPHIAQQLIILLEVHTEEGQAPKSLEVKTKNSRFVNDSEPMINGWRKKLTEDLRLNLNTVESQHGALWVSEQGGWMYYRLSRCTEGIVRRLERVESKGESELK